jgi:hypothetical protein
MVRGCEVRMAGRFASAIALLVVCALARCEMQAQTENAAAAAAVTLTDGHTKGTFPIAETILKHAPPVLRVRVTRVVNPANTAFQIFVFLAVVRDGVQTAAGKIPVGNAGLYPADRPGAFTLRASGAFEELKARKWGARGERVRLQVEIRRLHADRPWTHLEVTVVPPQWLDEARR